MKSKRIVRLLILALLLSVCLSACGQSPEKELKKTAEQFMEKVKAFDLESLNGFFKDAGELKLEEEEESFQAMAGYLREANGKLSYEIKSVDMEGGKVTLHCRYIDSTEFIGKFMVEAIQSAFSGAITEEMSEADRKAAYEKLIESSKKDLKDNFKEEDITISFEKTDNGWKIKEGDEALANIMTANFVGAMKNMMEDIGNSFGDMGDTSEYEANISQSGQLTQNGVLLKVKNENSVAVSHITADVMFENEAGEMIQMGTGFLDLLEAGEEAYVPVSYFGDKAPAKYSAAISCDVNDGYTDAKSQVTVEHNDGADSVLAKVTNNSGHTLSGISAVVLYYSGDQLIGFEEGNAYNVNDGKTERMEFYHPMDLNYEDLAYDRYELALFSAYYMD